MKLRLVIFTLAVLTAFLSIFITNYLVHELSIEEKKKIELWAEGMRQLSNLETTNQDYTFIFQVIQNNTTVPVLLTDEAGNVLAYRNIAKSDFDTPAKSSKIVSRFKKYHEPIVFTLVDSSKNYIYYRDSTTLIKLTFFPYIQIFVILILLLISYYGFRQARKAEQNKIWVGLAKETAHQLGTPTSSLLACLHILKGKNEVPEISRELEKDILRLEKISDRFSKIGSTPKIEDSNLIAVLNRTIEYLKNRVSNNISFTKYYDDKDLIILPINDILFEWVLENVIKNAIDAIQGRGEIAFSIHDHVQVVYLDITDDGRGVPKTKFKKIFLPGYTTKERGWGLGLTLSKRIIEEYHSGEIFINRSEINRGTTIRIVLPRKNKNISKI